MSDETLLQFWYHFSVFVYQILLLVFIVTPLCVLISEETLFLVFDTRCFDIVWKTPAHVWYMLFRLNTAFSCLIWLLNWSQTCIQMIGVNMAITATFFSSLLSNLTAPLVTLLIMITVQGRFWCISKFVMWYSVYTSGHLTVAVKSDGGTGDHTSYITVNGIDYSPHSAGINFVVIDYDTGRTTELDEIIQQYKVEHFHTVQSARNWQRLI